MVEKATCMKQGEPLGVSGSLSLDKSAIPPAAVRAAIVARKRRNGRGAKGGRKVDG
jgi:hypothetical protein